MTVTKQPATEPAKTAKLSARLTYANVTASLALFLALAGSSYAALVVTGKTVKDGSLTGRDIRHGSLTGGDVKDASLGARDFKRGQLPAGEQGPPSGRGT